MSATQTHAPSTTPSAASAPWRRLMLYLLRPALVFTAGMLLFLALFWALAVVVAVRAGTALPVEIMRYISVSSVAWVAFATAIGTVGAQVRGIVQSGFTRRAIVVAGAVCAVVVGMAFAAGSVLLAWTGVTLAERASTEALFVGTAPWWAVLGAVGLQCATAAASGLMTGASFVRWNGWATLLLPMTVGIPVIAQDALTGSVSRRGTVPGDGVSWAEQLQGLPTTMTVALSLSVLALTVLGAWLVIRDLPLRPRAAA